MDRRDLAERRGAESKRRVPTSGPRRSGSRARALYVKNCAQCHGEKGDGEGYATPHLFPRPRDFTTGKFKVRTTPNGALPTHQDLVNIIRRGMPYTSMPAWPDLSDQEVSDLAYFITTFSPDFSNAESVPQPVELPSAPAATQRVDRAREEALRGDRLREVPRQPRSGRRTFGSNADGRLGPSDTRGEPHAELDLPGRVVPRGYLPDDDHGVQRHADAVVRRQPHARATMGDHGLHRLALGEQRAWLYQPRRRQARPGSDRSGEGGRELRIRSCRPLSDHRTDHGARTLVPSSRDLRDRSGDLRRRVDRPSRSMARHERGEDGEERADRFPCRRRRRSRRQAGAAAGRRRARSATRRWLPPQPAADPFAEAAAPAAPPSEFSDAVSIQIPSQVPTGARKPYFIFGDAQNPVDLWFFDLARPEPLQFTGRGSADIAPNDTGDLTGVASYDQGEWSVIFKRPLRASLGRRVRARTVHADRLLGLGRVLARAWQQARSHGLVLPLRRAGSGPIGRRPDGEDGAASFSPSSWS